MPVRAVVSGLCGKQPYLVRFGQACLHLPHDPERLLSEQSVVGARGRASILRRERPGLCGTRHFPQGIEARLPHQVDDVEEHISLRDLAFAEDRREAEPQEGQALSWRDTDPRFIKRAHHLPPSADHLAPFIVSGNGEGDAVFVVGERRL